MVINKVLVTGANGMLGSSIKKVFDDKEILCTGSIELDVRNIEQVYSYKDYDFDVIIHLAAETDLAKCELNPADAYFTNQTGTQNVVYLAKYLSIPIVYIGTAGIFDGRKEAYIEKDKPNPQHHYGRSKYYGELAVYPYSRHYVVRSGWGMGGGPGVDKKFVNKIIERVKKGSKRIFAINDAFGNPTYTLDFAKTLRNILEANLTYGIYHSSGRNKASRYEVASEIVKLLGLNVEVVPVSYEEYFEMFPEYCRTNSEVLDISRLEGTGLSKMRNWQDSLKDYLEEYAWV